MKLFTFYILLGVSLLACKGVTVSNKDLEGKWKFSKVLRDDKETKTLESAYFVFNADNTVTSNIFSTEEKLKFEIQNSRLTIFDVQPFEFDIVNFQPGSLELTGEMGVNQMQFYLSKE